MCVPVCVILSVHSFKVGVVVLGQKMSLPSEELSQSISRLM